MKKLINFSGGRGYYVDDVKVLQEQLDSLKLVFKEFGNRHFIVYGCEVTPGASAGQINISPGLVYINGVFVEVYGATNFTADSDGKAYIVTANNSGYTGPEWYYDFVDEFKDALEYAFGEIVGTAPASGTAVVLSTNPFDRVSWLDYLKLLMTNEETKVQFDDWQGGFGGTIFYRKDFQGWVRFKKGSFLGFTPNGGGATSITLPVGYRPASNYFIWTAVSYFNQFNTYFNHGIAALQMRPTGELLMTLEGTQIFPTFMSLNDFYFRAV